MNQRPDVAVALDGMTLEDAGHLVDSLGDACTWVKVGLELYTRSGPEAVSTFRERGTRVFLDLKLHDIPNTVSGAVRAAAAHGVDLLTIHGSGGGPMIRSARRAADESGTELRLAAVTVLTSMSSRDLGASWGHDGTVEVSDHVQRIARNSVDAGAHGVVCSVHEAGQLREALGSAPWLVTPGIRLEGDSADDQARVATPAQAAAAGSTLLVVGRSITRATDPRTALERVRAEVAGVGAV